MPEKLYCNEIKKNYNVLNMYFNAVKMYYDPEKLHCNEI